MVLLTGLWEPLERWVLNRLRERHKRIRMGVHIKGRAG